MCVRMQNMVEICGGDSVIKIPLSSSFSYFIAFCNSLIRVYLLNL